MHPHIICGKINWERRRLGERTFMMPEIPNEEQGRTIFVSRLIAENDSARSKLLFA